jgi:uncharacterized protein YcbK (DUF882 family)
MMSTQSRVRVIGFRLIAVAASVSAVVLLVWLAIVLRRVLPDDASDAGSSLTAPGFDGAPGVDSASRQLTLPDTLFGRSGAVRFVALSAAEAEALGVLDALGDSILVNPRMYPIVAGGQPFHLFIQRPFGQKRGEMLGPYRLGRWPAEKWMMAENYLNPDGFVEVEPENADTPLSAHFRLRDFLTHDQQQAWPRYVALEERLIDKLELVLRELRDRGIDEGRVVVLSGFRAPYYNDLRIDEGAARASRHQFGDAADLIIDANGDGRMDDLNGDRRSDMRDLDVIGSAVAAVEKRYPELIGGLGTYAAMGPSGPFAHIDVRGTSARWERASATRADTSRRR